MINKFITNSELETEKIGQELIRNFPDNKLIIITGEIGVGKTILVRGIAKELRINDNIISPTFAIKKKYKNLVHYDLYFANKNQLSLNEFNSLITEDLVNNYVVIEWGNNLNLKNIKNFLKVDITVLKNQKRSIKWKLKGK
ncbi:/ ydiB / YdiB /:59536 Forward [Candidatus Hepatoplasma crinochetorum]|uniref:tRNA threonylcarbamoyladenosine biosynthesis protein TsaE n=1 Tax=Candidatus Hepatoplasma crinochetorum TaxID=295596 RepID=A0A0G7ZNA2_9MOLU|nr:/ ydiB / YdiB /:59536 Forward [Candidatus Hepatoplasma crinochetorum]